MLACCFGLSFFFFFVFASILFCSTSRWSLLFSLLNKSLTTTQQVADHYTSSFSFLYHNWIYIDTMYIFSWSFSMKISNYWNYCRLSGFGFPCFAWIAQWLCCMAWNLVWSSARNSLEDWWWTMRWLARFCILLIQQEQGNPWLICLLQKIHEKNKLKWSLYSFSHIREVYIFET